MTNPFAAPDTSALTSATGADREQAAEFYRRLAMLQQQYDQQLAAQSALGRSLDRTIAGTAPSVAGTQLQQGVGQIRNAVASEAAGAGGNNAALAQYGGIQAIAAAQAKANQEAAVLRAKEIHDAQVAKAGLLNQQQGATGNMAGINASGGTSLSGAATTGAGNIAKINEDETNAWRNFVSNLSGGVGGTLTKIATA